MRYSYSFEQRLPYPAHKVFLFLCDPANLPRLMPAWQKARISEMHLKPPVPPAGESVPLAWRIAGEGSEITLSFRPFPLLPFRLSWTARIEEFHWGQGFVDVQTAGPFSYWKHRHSIVERAEGSSVIDEVEFIPPGFVVGSLAKDLLSRQIRRTFAERQAALARKLGRP